MRTRRHLGRGEGSQPDAALLAGLPDFGHPFSPRAHSHPSVNRVLAVVVAVNVVVVVALS